MAKNNLITIYCFGQEIGRLGYDEQRGASTFQYNDVFLQSEQYPNLFPLLIKRTKLPQVFNRYNNDTFRGLPPAIADSLPDVFGNIIFRAWTESSRKNLKQISVLEQLAYVGIRGMGALEYHPAKTVSADDTIDLHEITGIVKQVLDQKSQVHEHRFDHAALLNIFKIGTSAGGVRPKILVSEHKSGGTLIPGDIVFDDNYNHYLIKLGIDNEGKYSRELIEYSYYLAATHASIGMMDSKMIGNTHFATLRFDRRQGRKKHTLTTTGITGLDYKDPDVSSYENLFELLLFLKCPHADTEQLFRRMVFNLVFANHDDHLKNHSFIYDEEQNNWHLAPAYDLTYSLNPEINFTTTSRALSVNGKRKGIETADLKAIAEKYTVKHFRKILAEVQDTITYWQETAKTLDIPAATIHAISKNFMFFKI